MATGYLSPLYGSGEQVFNSQGLILASGSITTYLAGTTTPATTYSDIGLNTSNQNPIPLNSAARPSTALGVAVQIWLQAGVAYKFVIKDSDGVTIPGGTWDNITGIPSVSTISTFVPQVSIGGVTSGIAYGTQLGFYTTANGRVYADIDIVLTSKNALTGAVVIGNLPVAVIATTGYNAAVNIYADTLAAGIVAPFQAKIIASATSFALTKMIAGAATAVDGADLTNTSKFSISLNYQIT